MERVGAWLESDNICTFRVYAPFRRKVELKIHGESEGVYEMQQNENGYWSTVLYGIVPGIKYSFIIEGKLERPDPASHFQPEGVHSPSILVDHNLYQWNDISWQPPHLKDLVIYELHTGTFSPEGNFEGIEKKISYFKELGVNALEIMPVAQFPGNRNWGYDSVYPFAVQHSYGGPEGLKKLVDTCHDNGLAVILDVIYNHLGPEGNYLNDFGPYFTDKYKTPWGKALNFDDEYSDHVRSFFIQNALMWFDIYHVDALRLDAIHAIYDFSALHFLQQLAESTMELSKAKGRDFYLIAESDLNDARVVKPTEEGGYGIDAQWADDFHHALHALVTNEKEGYYLDFGSINHLKETFKRGFFYNGIYSRYREKTFGNDASKIPAEKFIVCSQNHDQVGNRITGDRLSTLVPEKQLKVIAATVILSPYIPLLFMGEEYGEENPFLYFISHTDPGLAEAVRKGRKEEFKAFQWKADVPDPQSEETFNKSKLDWGKLEVEKHKELFNYYKELIKLRKSHPVLKVKDKSKLSTCTEGKALIVERYESIDKAICIFNYGDQVVKFPLPEDIEWKKIYDSEIESNKLDKDKTSEAIAASYSVVVYDTL